MKFYILLIVSLLLVSKVYASNVSVVVNQEQFYKDLPLGMSLIVNKNGQTAHNEPILLIPGVDEQGDNWYQSINDLLDSNLYDVYIYKWNAFQDPSNISVGIANSLNQLQERYDNKFYDLSVIAHSMGGVLLLSSLCESEDKKKCPFILKHKSINFVTLASPFGGYSQYSPNILKRIIKAFIGPVKMMMGHHRQYNNINKNIVLNIYKTSFQNDHVMKQYRNYDIRVPSPFNNYNLDSELLKDDSHTSSIQTYIEYFLEN